MITEKKPHDGFEIPISDKHFQGTAILKRLAASNGFKILLKKGDALSDQITFKYDIYQLDTADVNRDGRTDILVGLIKPTEFDPVERKRLFILRIDDGYLRPLWLGSKVCQELVNFRTTDRGRVKTLERNKNGNYAIGLYEWQSFGLTLTTYIHDEISLHEASQFFVN